MGIGDGFLFPNDGYIISLLHRFLARSRFSRIVPRVSRGLARRPCVVSQCAVRELNSLTRRRGPATRIRESWLIRGDYYFLLISSFLRAHTPRCICSTCGGEQSRRVCSPSGSTKAVAVQEASSHGCMHIRRHARTSTQGQLPHRDPAPIQSSLDLECPSASPATYLPKEINRLSGGIRFVHWSAEVQRNKAFNALSLVSFGS